MYKTYSIFSKPHTLTKIPFLQTLREATSLATEINPLHLVHKSKSNACLRLIVSMEMVGLLLFALLVCK